MTAEIVGEAQSEHRGQVLPLEEGSLLLTSYWPKQVTWRCLAWRGRRKVSASIMRRRKGKLGNAINILYIFIFSASWLCFFESLLKFLTVTVDTPLVSLIPPQRVNILGKQMVSPFTPLVRSQPGSFSLESENFNQFSVSANPLRLGFFTYTLFCVDK